MNNKLTTLIIIALSMLTFVLAQDGDAPLALPGAVNQGPIGGMAWLAMSGLILAAKKYLSNNKIELSKVSISSPTTWQKANPTTVIL